MLAFVIGRATPIEPIANFGDLPGVQTLLPHALLPPYGIAVTIGQDHGQALAFDPFPKEQRAAFGIGIVEDFTDEAHCLEPRLHGLGQVAERLAAGFRRRVLAFAAE